MLNSRFSMVNSLALSATIHHWLLFSSGFSCFLLLARVIVTNSLAYLFLPWNLFLAFVPYWIAGRMFRNSKLLTNRIYLYLILAAWLLFIPNSFYIVTDLFHLSHIDSAPKWFDLLLVFSFAWNGILFGVVSLRRIELFTSTSKSRNFSLVMVFAVMWLNAFGVYIGRFLRYNSWDVITHPFSLAGEILDMIIRPITYGYAWGMTCCYAVFMTFLYQTIKRLSESFVIQKSPQY